MGIFLIVLFLLHVVFSLRFMVRLLTPARLNAETCKVLRAFRPSLIRMEYEDAQELVIMQAKKMAIVPAFNLFGFDRVGDAVIESHRSTVMKCQLKF